LAVVRRETEEVNVRVGWTDARRKRRELATCAVLNIEWNTMFEWMGRLFMYVF
jgi:hypothetical protein